MKKRLLFVDDELNIRITLPAILEMAGFEVSVAGSVPEALNAIQKQEFDILLSDLNIGQPGDGFTVVSAMRRIQPQATTFILTGYPDFESALLAIRNQVDDYFTKPANIPKMIAALKEKSAGVKEPYRVLPMKRVSVVIRENQQEIIRRWLTRHSSHAELSQVPLSDREKIDHVPRLIDDIANRIEAHPNLVSETLSKAAALHGAKRYEQGYTIPMMLVEASLLECVLADLLQEHLLAIDISTLIPDIHQMTDAINRAVEQSIRAYLRFEPEAQSA